MKGIKHLSLLFVAIVISAVTLKPQSQSLENLEKKAHSLSIRQDENGISQFKLELENVPTDGKSNEDLAKLSYLKAFCDFQIIQINYGQVDDRMGLFSSSKRSLEEALKLNPKYTEAKTLMAILTAASLPPGKALEAVQGDIKEIKKMKDGDVYSNMVAGYAELFAPSGGVVALEKAKLLLEKNKKTKGNWWYWNINGLLTDVYLGNFKRPAEYEKAQKILNSIRKNEPEMGYLRVIAPYLADQTLKQLRSAPKISWTELATDAGDDARNPQKMFQLPEGDYDIFDVKQLHYALDFSQGMVWFKFDYETFPSENFGINIMIDTDGDSENGNTWMTNKEFKYDLNGTLYLRKQGNSFVGVNGLSTGHDWARRRLAVTKEGAFQFFVDKANKSLIVGVAHQHLGFSQSMKVFATTGTNEYWEDNIPDTGGVDITP